MVGLAFIVEGMSATPRPVLTATPHHWTELVVIAGNLDALRYREDILLPRVVPFLQAHPDMTLQHDNATSHTARSVRDFL